MDEKRQVQKELFEEFAEKGKKRHFKGILYPEIKKTFSISYEHILFIVIGLIIIAVVSYSIGVERGKSIRPKIEEPLPAETVEIGGQRPYFSAEEESENKGAVPLFPKEEAAPAEQKAAEKPIFTVRVASYLKESTADKEAELLKNKGSDAFIYESGKYYVVCVGRFNDKNTALSARKSLLKSYPDCYVKEQ